MFQLILTAFHSILQGVAWLAATLTSTFRLKIFALQQFKAACDTIEMDA